MSGYDVSVETLPVCGMLDLRGDEAVKVACEDTIGLQFPSTANTLVAGAGQQRVCCISPDHWILQLDDDRTLGVLESLERSAAGLFHSFVDVSDMHVRIQLTGAESREVLAQGVGIDLHPSVFPPGSYARTGFARTTAQLLCIDEKPTYIITVFRSYQQYAIDWLEVARGAA